MMKLKRYLKPYIGFALAAIVLMSCQAAVDLNLPNLMSDIVNVGIQQGGITEAAPKAVSAEGLQLMSAFMSEEDRALAQSQYVLAEQANMTADEWDRFVTDWPKVSDTDVYRQIPNLDDSTQAQLDSAFSRASYALMTVVKDLAEQSGQDIAAGDTDSKAMDMSKLGELVPMLAMLPQGMVDDAIAAAAATPESMLSQTAAVFTKGFYMQLGADTDAMQTSYIFRTGGKMLLMALLLAVCAISVGFCGSRMGAGIARDLRRDIFAKVTSFTNNEYDKFGTASLITRSTNDVTQVQGLVTMGLRIMCYAPIIGIGGTIMALSKSVSMAWVIALAVVLILGLICTISAIAMPRFKIMQQLVDKLNLVSRENLSGMMVIRAFATQDFEEKRFDKANKDLADNNLFVFRAMATMMPVMMLVMNGVSLLIVWVGGHQIADSAMQVGDMMAFIQYTMQIIMSFLMISMMFVMVPRASVSAGRIADVLASETSVQDAPQPRHLPEKVKGLVQFNDVSFHYEGADENVLEHVTFTARPGETTAFIGSTGSGKSTLINLIPRFYDVSAGSVTVDGVDVRDIPQHELRDAIGYVPQKGVLFSGDISSNLRYGGEDADADVLRRAAEVAQATEFIDELPDGFETAISQGGTNVSGGQRQRLSIARALVKKAPVYIFDDTFSALDFKTDAKLRKALKGYTEGATVLIVAQRVSTIMHAEQIVVLDEGRVMGIGTHRELLASCKTYREIAESQLSKEELA
mgnify:FL=1